MPPPRPTGRRGRRLHAVSQHLTSTSGGLRVSASPPPQLAAAPPAAAAAAFGADGDRDGQRAAAVEHVHREGYAVLTDAVPLTEIRALSDWVAASQSANPGAWPVDPRDGQRLYSHPLLDSAAAGILDSFLRPPRTFGVIDELLGGEACFAQLDFRDIPATTQRSTKDREYILHRSQGSLTPDCLHPNRPFR